MPKENGVAQLSVIIVISQDTSLVNALTKEDPEELDLKTLVTCIMLTMTLKDTLKNMKLKKKMNMKFMLILVLVLTPKILSLKIVAIPREVNPTERKLYALLLIFHLLKFQKKKCQMQLQLQKLQPRNQKEDFYLPLLNN